MAQTSQTGAKVAPARRTAGEQLYRALGALRGLRRPIIISFGVFLASFVRWMGIPSPFAAALLLCLGEKSSPFTLLGLGASLALRLLWGIDPDLWQYAGCMALWLIRLRFNPREGVETAALTGLSMLPRAVAAIALGSSSMDMLLCCAALPIGMLASAILRGSVQAIENGYPLKALRDKAGVATLCLVLVGGLGYFKVAGLNLGHIAAVAATAAAAYCGGGAAGTLCGLLFGLSLSLIGHSGAAIISLALCGLICGIMPKKRWLMPSGAIAANLLAYFVTRSPGPPLSFIAAALGALALLPISSEGLERISAFTSPRALSGMESRFVRKRIEHLQGAVKRVAASLPVCDESEASDGAELGSLLCARCSGREQCWNRDKAQTERILGTVMQLSQSGKDGEMTPMLDTHGCLRAEAAAQATRDALALRARRKVLSAKACFEREQTLNHLGAMLGNLKELEALASGDSMSDLQAAHAISRAMEELQIPARLEYARRVDGHLQASLRAESVLPIQKHLEGLLRRLEEAEDMPLSITHAARGCVELEEIPLYSVSVGAASLCAGAGGEDKPVCGDSVSVQRCDGGRLLAMLSDGMGHGEKAHKQSSKTLELLSLLLEAGYTRRQAITAVNGIMLGTQEESFSTVDLCDIDLWTGDVYNEKLGASASWIVRGNHCKKIEGASLPLGIIEEASPTSSQFKLHSGDILVMVSDGVADACAQDEDVHRLLGDSLFIQPQRMADAILRNALLCGGGKPKDDMSVVVMLIMDRRRGVM